MRRGCKRLALALAPLLALPAAAEAAANDPGDYAVTATRGDTASADRQRARDLARLPEENVPGRLVSLMAAPDVELGVGMFSVVGSTEKEMIRRRTEPATDVRSRESRVAAVGLSLRF